MSYETEKKASIDRINQEKRHFSWVSKYTKFMFPRSHFKEIFSVVEQ